MPRRFPGTQGNPEEILKTAPGRFPQESSEMIPRKYFPEKEDSQKELKISHKELQEDFQKYSQNVLHSRIFRINYRMISRRNPWRNSWRIPKRNSQRMSRKNSWRMSKNNSGIPEGTVGGSWGNTFRKNPEWILEGFFDRMSEWTLQRNLGISLDRNISKINRNKSGGTSENNIGRIPIGTS